MGTTASRRKIWSITLGSILLVLFSAYTALNAWTLKFLSPATTGEFFAFTGISAVAFLIFVAVLVLLVRNVLKLYADQRKPRHGHPPAHADALGRSPRVAHSHRLHGDLQLRPHESRGRPLVFAARHRDARRLQPHGPPACSVHLRQRPRRSRIHRRLADPRCPSRAAFAGQARNFRRTPPVPTRAATDRVLHQHEITLQHGFAIVYREGRALSAFNMPRRAGASAQVKPWLPDTPLDEDDADTSDTAAPGHTPGDDLTLGDPTDDAILAVAQRNDQPIFSLGGNDYALGTAGMQQGGTVVVGLPTPADMSATMSRLRTAADAYWTVYRSRRQVRNLYLSLMLMLTSLALFASQLARPASLEASHQARRSPRRRHGSHRRRRLRAPRRRKRHRGARSELVRSFNHMAGDLEGSRRAVEESTLQLSAANASLEARRTELETMLETIPNGVATLDTDRRVVLVNRALTEMLDPGGQVPFIGTSIESVAPAELMEGLDRLLRRSHRMGAASAEMEIASPGPRGGGTINLLVTVALLETGNERTHHGYVLVLENATELLRAQKQSAWKEVARRVAHEIKNPLTPISLSAEQIRRHIDRLAATLDSASVESPSTAVIRRSSEVISSSVESMRSLVDQFASLAEFPTARPRPADLNTIVENSLAIFAGRLQNIRLVTRLAPDLPLVMADPESMKRSLGNLIDNAAEAMQQSRLRETAPLHHAATLGHGRAHRLRHRRRPHRRHARAVIPPRTSLPSSVAPALGLAIAAKIIQEHQGTIRAEKNEPAGAKFIVELRPASLSRQRSERRDR